MIKALRVMIQDYFKVTVPARSWKYCMVRYGHARVAVSRIHIGFLKSGSQR
jgi:hypothetical protein